MHSVIESHIYYCITLWGKIKPYGNQSYVMIYDIRMLFVYQVHQSVQINLKAIEE